MFIRRGGWWKTSRIGVMLLTKGWLHTIYFNRVVDLSQFTWPQNNWFQSSFLFSIQVKINCTGWELNPGIPRAWQASVLPLKHQCYTCKEHTIQRRRVENLCLFRDFWRCLVIPSLRGTTDKEADLEQRLLVLGTWIETVTKVTIHEVIDCYYHRPQDSLCIANSINICLIKALSVI